MQRDPLPSFVSSLSKYHTVKDHFAIVWDIHHDMPVNKLVGQFHRDLVATAKQRYLLMKGDRVIRDKLVDLVHSEGAFTQRVKMVMYFLFMFRDQAYREFICGSVGVGGGKWNSDVFRSTTAGSKEFKDKGGRKAFTNLRRFLVHTGILDEEYRVSFPPLSSWFPWAVEICAQYVSDEVARQHLLTSPHGFLIKYRLNGLVNATAEELAAVELGGTYEGLNDFLPTYEDPNAPHSIRVYPLQKWSRRRRTGQTALEMLTALTDPAKLERANTQHFLLEKSIAALCTEVGLQASSNGHIDVLAQNEKESIIFEMKSANAWTARSQIRRALSQLFEYRYLYGNVLRPRIHLCVVIERKPKGQQGWLIEYLDSVGVGIIWKNDEDDLLNCSEGTKQKIAHLLPKVLGPNFGPATDA